MIFKDLIREKVHATNCRYDIAIQGVPPNRSKPIIFIFQIHIIEGLEKLLYFIVGPHGY